MELYILQDKHKASWTVKTMDYRNATVHAIYIHILYNTFQLHMLTLYASMDEILKNT